MDSKAVLEEMARVPVVILAGGYGSRIAEETHLIPKPMIDLRGTPIIVHIMDFYAKYGFTNFVICGGYKIEVLKNYFVNLPLVGQDVEVEFSGKAEGAVVTRQSKYVESQRRDWKVTILETGLTTMTGGRLYKAFQYLKDRGHQRCCVTYGDGLTDVDLVEEFRFHLNHKKIGTLLGVHQPTRFGILQYNDDQLVTSFAEKPKATDEYINGGYFIFELAFEQYLQDEGDSCVLEKAPLESLARDGQLKVLRHQGFWQCMDTVREKMVLEQLIDSNDAPWKKRVNIKDPLFGAQVDGQAQFQKDRFVSGDVTLS